jgi:hypothetical protein
MKRLALVVAASAALAVPASAQEPVDTSVQYTLGRVLHTTPDRNNRIGIRSACNDSGGCKVKYRLTSGSRLLGGIDALLLANTTQTDYVTLTKRMAASLRRKRLSVLITADASDAVGNKQTFTKRVTLGPKRR